MIKKKSGICKNREERFEVFNCFSESVVDSFAILISRSTQFVPCNGKAKKKPQILYRISICCFLVAFFQEYAAGGNLGTLIRSVTFSEKESIFYLTEILLSVDSLHHFGFVHRDLKPDNFLIDQTGHIKLADFGLSKGGVLKKLESRSAIKVYFEDSTFKTITITNTTTTNELIAILHKTEKQPSFLTTSGFFGSLQTLSQLNIPLLETENFEWNVFFCNATEGKNTKKRNK